jgi:hypothetical protein
VQTQGRLLTAATVREGVLILTDTDAHVLRFVGGDLVYGLEAVGTHCGVMSRRALVTSLGQGFWVGKESLFRYARSLAPLACSVQDWLFASLNRSYAGRVFAAINSQYDELWWFFPDGSSTNCNRYAALSLGEGVWTIGSLTRSSGDPRGAFSLPSFGSLAGLLYTHEVGWTADGAARLGQVYAESAELTVGEAEGTVHVTRLVPDVAPASDRVAWQFLTRMERDAPERTRGPYRTLRADGNVDVRFAARHMRVRVEAAQDAEWALGRPRLDLQPAGRR